MRGEQVLVYDGDGYFMAVGLAEKLAREGRRVTYVTPFHEAAPYLNYTGEGRYINRLLRSLGVEMVPAHVVIRSPRAACAATISTRSAPSSGPPTARY